MQTLKYIKSKGHKKSLLLIPTHCIPDGYTLDDINKLKEKELPIPYIETPKEKIPEFLKPNK